MRTAKGNNNTYAQDNDFTWINWAHVQPAGYRMLELVKQLLKIRKQHSVMESEEFFNDKTLVWYRPDAHMMGAEDWSFYVRALSCFIFNKNKNLFMIFNAFNKDIKWVLPTQEKGKWKLVLDTSNTYHAGTVLKWNYPCRHGVFYSLSRSHNGLYGSFK